MARTRVIIDTDPGVDDAVAILLALASEELDVVAITSVAGNVGIDATTLNARRLVELAQRPDVPVARGSARPLNGDPQLEVSVHGADGLGDLDWDEPAVAEHELGAIDLQYRLITEAPTTIVAIGPLTNLANLLARYPQVESLVERVVIMGGASFEGNVTPAAEFNIWFDPEAAAAVAAARWPMTFMPLDLTHQALLNDQDLAHLRGLDTAVGHRVAAMLEPYATFHDEWYGSRDVIMHDATAVYELIDPTAIEKQGVAVTVETGGDYSRGATWFDRRRANASSSTTVGVSLDNDRFVSVIRERLARYA